TGSPSHGGRRPVRPTTRREPCREGAMTAQLEASIVRIFAKNGAIVGTGFLVSGRCILTCAHVVVRALGLSQATQEIPVAEIRFDFPLLEQRKTLTAHPIFWSPATGVG